MRTTQARAEVRAMLTPAEKELEDWLYVFTTDRPIMAVVLFGVMVRHASFDRTKNWWYILAKARETVEAVGRSKDVGKEVKTDPVEDGRL